MNRELGIYVISAGPSTKIGVSYTPRQRLANLQAANPNQILSLAFVARGTMEIVRKAERDAHAILSDRCIRGEWFSVTPDVAIKAVIQAVNEGYGI